MADHHHHQQQQQQQQQQQHEGQHPPLDPPQIEAEEDPPAPPPENDIPILPPAQQPPFYQQQIVSDDGIDMPHLGDAPFATDPQQAMAMAQYYEARMRDHAAAYASAAAGAAWAAAQIAVSSRSLPPSLPPCPPAMMYAPHPYDYPPPPHPPYYDPRPAFPPRDNNHHNYSRNDEQEHDEQRPGKRHQRLPPAASNSNQERRGRRRQRDYSSSSDTASNRSYQYHPPNKSSRRHHQQPKKRSENLAGKNGISALHEWCVRRKKLCNYELVPSEEPGFTFSVHIDDMEWSRGHGSTKGAAKQEAARKTLQALVPGVVFDETGLVVSTTDTDVLPNFAQSLKIDSKKRRCDFFYPSPATTSSGEDDSTNQGGLAACTALLHAMWQINKQIPEPPSYSFEVVNREESRISSFLCNGTLKLKVNKSDDGPKEDEDNHDGNDSLASSASHNYNTKVLKATGTGPTKREARHVASAKLLAMLFPDCEGMAPVKAAAEAARESYATSKAQKQESKRSHHKMNTSSAGFLLAKATDPDIPTSVVEVLGKLTSRGTGSLTSARIDEDEVSVESLSISETTGVGVARDAKAKSGQDTEDSTKNVGRAISRQQQLEKLADEALQLLNEHDEGGRSLPLEPDFDNVGRTVLRRAEAGDARFIQKLLCRREKTGKVYPEAGSLLQSFVSPSEFNQCNYGRIGGPSHVILFLCRAIAPFDESPLGCAILTSGFSWDKGCLLRVAELGSEPHLPRERFVECLQQFAVNMKCSLEIGDVVACEKNPVEGEEISDFVLTTEQLDTIVDSYLNRRASPREEVSGPTLQAVKEEEAEFDEEKEPVNPKVETVKDKPSKRSRLD